MRQSQLKKQLEFQSSPRLPRQQLLRHRLLSYSKVFVWPYSTLYNYRVLLTSAQKLSDVSYLHAVVMRSVCKCIYAAWSYPLFTKLSPHYLLFCSVWLLLMSYLTHCWFNPESSRYQWVAKRQKVFYFFSSLYIFRCQTNPGDFQADMILVLPPARN